MNKLPLITLILALLSFAAFAADAPVKALVITGGHGYDVEPFDVMLKALSGVQCTHVDAPDDGKVFEDALNWSYDVIVLYNMGQQISDKSRENLLALLDKGVGLVVLHHAIASFNDWPEYWKIIGAHYYLKNYTEKGKEHAQSTWKEGVEFKLSPADKDHPIVKGVTPFTVHDETYAGFTTEPDNHPLLNAEGPGTEPVYAWWRTCKNANVFYMVPGHGPTIFADENYRRVVSQAIQWAAKPANKAAAEKGK